MSSPARDALGLNVSIRTIKDLDMGLPKNCNFCSCSPGVAKWIRSFLKVFVPLGFVARRDEPRKPKLSGQHEVSKLSSAQVTPSSCTGSEPGFMRAVMEISL